jgi:glycosyltransferase involved in cell wall biosynthesis
MRVLQINTDVNTGSTGHVAEDIGKLLIANGHESYIAYGRGNRQSESKLLRIGNNFDVLFHIIKTRISDKHGFGSKKATYSFIKRVESLRPDIIILHNIHGYYINIELLFNYLNKAKIPVVWTLFDCWAFTGHCSYFDDINCTRWESECYSCPKSHRYPESILSDNSRNNYFVKKRLFNTKSNLHLIVHSAWLESLVKKSFLGKLPIHLIPNGIDTDIFKPIENNIREKYNIKNRQIILGCASIWDKRKGFDDFLKLSENLDPQQIIMLVGLSKKQIQKLPPGIIGINRTENIQELAALYSSADVFVNPTWQDNFPTTNLESLACGTPVVTYNTGGSPEAVDTNTGLIVNKGDTKALSKAINMVLQKRKTFYSKQCRERAIQLFNYKRQFGEYLKLFQHLVEKETEGSVPDDVF